MRESVHTDRHGCLVRVRVIEEREHDTLVEYSSSHGTHRYWVANEPIDLEHRMECVGCGREFDPIKYRWLCPECKTKNSCCEGAPL